MFEWLKEKYTEYKLNNHITKEQCFVFPILSKSCLEDGEKYETFDFSERNNMKIAQWCAKKDCFIPLFSFDISTMSYDEFKPLRKAYSNKSKIIYEVCSYNPCEVNQLDLEELKKITFDLNDDNTESDEVWEKLIKYFEDRGIY